MLRTSLVIILLSLVSSSLFAEADGPDYWRVYGVAENDVLNQRRFPDYRSEKIGEIPAAADCVRNIACRGGLTLDEYSRLDAQQAQRLLKQRPRWCRVAYAGVTGWVAGKYLRESGCDKAQAKSFHVATVDPYNHHYRVENDDVYLRYGSDTRTIPGTASVIITEISGRPLVADIDADGVDDAVVILMQHTGGSGVFYYIALALANAVSVESAFVGDRIEIEQVALTKQGIRLVYVDRSPEQAMVEKPKLRHRVRYVLKNNRLVMTSDKTE